MSATIPDRATIVTGMVREIVTASSIPEADQWLFVEAALRDEFDDARREVVADRRLADD
jgi:hypothetical protein